jgi:hypothetical protein
MKKAVITLRSQKGVEWQLTTTENKIATVKNNAPKWGATVVKVEVK